jgi:Ca2+ transporting ATPase
MEDAFCRSAGEVLETFRVQKDTGLSEEQVALHARLYGQNRLAREEGVPLWQLILKQFQDQLVLILLCAAGISFVLALFEEADDRVTAFFEPLVIVLILAANAAVGVIQETNAEKAIEALREYEPDAANVLRNGALQLIRAEELVPGDIIEVSVGMRIPADCRIIELASTVLYADQSILTGESVSVSKSPEPVPDKQGMIQDKNCMLFAGCTVVRGKAKCVVTAVGERTEIGKVRRNIAETKAVTTPLKRRLDEFGSFLSRVILVICILVWLINVRNFWNPEHGNALRGAVYYFKIAVALAVAAIPEGLPAVVTTCLALGTKRMARKNAIVRSLPSVETLGCTSVICSDKTGTLTTNRMSVTRLVLVSGLLPSGHGKLVELEITGHGDFSPFGQVIQGGSVLPSPLKAVPQLAELGVASLFCNDASIVFDMDSRHFDKIGEGTEAALITLVEKLRTSDEAYNSEIQSMSLVQRASAAKAYWSRLYERVATLEFTRDRKSMSVFCRRLSDDTLHMFVKGAPERIIERCQYARLNDGKRSAMTQNLRRQLLEAVTDLSAGVQALRILAIAVRDDPPPLESIDMRDTGGFSRYESDLTFIGLVGMVDPPREEVRSAIETCGLAGIRVIVITGDNKATAEAICRQIGIFDDYEDLSGKSYTGREFESFSEEARRQAVQSARLFARVEPLSKQRIVTLLQELGEVVAVTGDGVNDAPALKAADIGIAMGTGTAVAKGAAEMVLGDDNFATIVTAVEEGRAIYENMRQFIRYLISSNIGEVWCVFLTAVLHTPEALAPVQLLWVNLVTDGLPATALSFNKPTKNIMQQPPRPNNEHIVNGWLLFRYLVIGTYVGIATIAGLIWWYMFYSKGPQLTWAELRLHQRCRDGLDLGSGQLHSCDVFRSRHPSTVSLSILVTIEMLNALNSLSENESVTVVGPWSNPFLILAICLSMVLHATILYVPFFNRVFATAPLDFQEWIAVVWLSLPVIWLDEGLKYFSRLQKRRLTWKKNR